MDDLDKVIESLMAQFRDACIAERLVPFAVMTTTEEGDIRVFYNTELSVDDMIANCEYITEYLKDIKKKSEDN